MVHWAAWRRLAWVLVLWGVASGCTHWVVIRSSPAGARAKIDGTDMGTTPFFFEETTGWSKTYRLELEKPGYEPLAVKLEQNDLQWRYACPSVCLCPPTLGLSLAGCLFSYGLADEYDYVLVPLDDSARPPAVSGSTPGDGWPDGGAAPDAGNPPANIPKKDEDAPAVVPF